MVIIPKLRCKNGENIGVELFIKLPDLEGVFTFLNTDYALGVSAFAVENGSKFATDDYFVIGNIQSQKTEILKVSTTTATAVNTSSASLYAHSRGETLQFIPYNQIEVYKSTDGITYNLLTTLDIRVDSLETYYNDTDGLTTDYYKVRFKNSTSSKYSSYSDSVIGTGYIENSAGSVIRKALISLGCEIDDKLITKEFVYEALNELRRDIDQDKNIIRWPFRTAFNYDAGNVIPGQYKITLPANLRGSSTNENILSVSIGRNLPLRYVDMRGLNAYYLNVGHSTLNGAITVGSTSVILTSSGDFDESGSFDISAEAVNETIDNVLYTANDESTNTLSGVTGIRTAGHSTAVDVWQNASFGLPRCYTVDNGELIFNCPFSDDYAGENIWIDYYKTITDINSDADLLDEPFYHIFIPGLKWKIKLRKNNDLKIGQDSDFIEWSAKRGDQIEKNYMGQTMKISIDLI